MNLDKKRCHAELLTRASWKNEDDVCYWIYSFRKCISQKNKASYITRLRFGTLRVRR